MKKSLVLALVLAVGVVFTSVVPAQRSDSYQFADRDGVWTVKTSDQSMAAIRLLPAQRQVLVQKRDAIFDVVRASKVLNPLKGADINVEKSVVARADDQGRYPTTEPVVMSIRMTFGPFFQDEKTGRVSSGMIGAAGLNVVTNDLAAIAWWGPNRLYAGMHDERGHVLFLDPRVAATIAGRTVYRILEWGDVVVLTNGRPLWVPLKQEQFLRAMVNHARVGRAEEVERGRSALYTPSEAESTWVQQLHVFEKELSALTPSERQQPAYWSDPPRDNPFLSGLTKRETYGARLVVMANPDYFDPSLPRTAVQLIACTFDFMGAHDESESEQAETGTLNRLFKQFEYDKLAALVEGARPSR